MASNVNIVVISGSLAADPEVRWTAADGESAIVRLGVIVRKSKKNSEGEYEDVSSIFDAEVGSKFALLCARKLKKFDNVTVSGELVKDEWEKDGEKRSKIKVRAFNVDSEGFFRPQSEDNTPATAAAPAAPAQTESLPTSGPTSDDLPF